MIRDTDCCRTMWTASTSWPSWRWICVRYGITPTDAIWRALDPVLWELTHNPWGVLQTVSRERIERVSADPEFRKLVDEFRAGAPSGGGGARVVPSWPTRVVAAGCVAYFSMEFMLSEALPIYSGGLGNVAGDQLKAASDLGVPVVGGGVVVSPGLFSPSH